MTPEFLVAELSRIERRLFGLPEPLVRLQQLEEVLCGDLPYEDRQKYSAEFLELTRLPWEQAA